MYYKAWMKEERKRRGEERKGREGEKGERGEGRGEGKGAIDNMHKPCHDT